MKALLTSLVLLAAPAGAVVIDEATAGDFSDRPNTIGALSLGQTEIFGEITGVCDEPRPIAGCDFVGDDRDHIGFTVAPGTVLTGFSFRINDLITFNPQRQFTATGYARFQRSDQAIVPGLTTPLLTDGPYGGLAGDLGAGDYFVSFSSAIGSSSVPGDTVNFNYSIELTTEAVAPVPLPASGILLMAGLGALAVRRRGRN